MHKFRVTLNENLQRESVKPYGPRTSHSEAFILGPPTCRCYVNRRHINFAFHPDDSRSVAYSTTVLNPNMTADESFRKKL